MATKLAEGVPSWMRRGSHARTQLDVARFTRSVEEGATCEVLCCTSTEAVDGGYFRMSREGVLEQIPSSGESYDEEKARRLWEMSLQPPQSPATIVHRHLLEGAEQ